MMTTTLRRKKSMLRLQRVARIHRGVRSVWGGRSLGECSNKTPDDASSRSGVGKLEDGSARFEDVLDYWASLSPSRKEELVREASALIKNPPTPEVAAKVEGVYDDIHRLWGVTVRAAMGAASLFSRFM